MTVAGRAAAPWPATPRTVLAVAVAGQASYASVYYAVPVLAPALQAQYGLALPELGVALASLEVGAAATVFVWGVLSDALGERLVMAVGLAVAVCALLGAAFAPSYVLLVAALVVAGMGAACVPAAGGRAVMSVYPAGARGTVLAVRQTVPLALAAAGSLTLPQVLGTAGVRAAFLVLAAIVAMAAVASALGLRLGATNCTTRDATLTPLRDSRVWRLAIASCLLIVAQTFFLAFFVVFLHDTRGFSTAHAAAVFACVQLLGAGLRLAAGRWSDLLESRLLPLTAFAVASACALALAAAVLGAPLPAMLPVVAGAGLISLGWNSLSFTATAELAGAGRAGAALGIQQTAVSLGTFAAPIAFAQLVADVSWRAGFAVAAAFSAAAATMLWRLRGLRPDD